jgi:pyruvate dehydrogenase E2 component (dihydrolipoamide acetyltransferase)
MIEVIMPKLGLTMEEGTIIRWLKAEGEEVEKGEPLFEVQTDKVNMEVEAPASGTLGKILVPEGETVAVVRGIAYILEPGEEAPEEWPLPVAAVEAIASRPPAAATKPLATPAAKRLARDKGIDLTRVRGSGEGGMVTREDLFAFLEEKPAPEVTAAEQVKASPRARRLAQEKGVPLSVVEGSGPEGRITEQDILDLLTSQELVTPSPIQRVTAERLSQSFTTAPHFYLVVECQATKLVEWRERLIPIIEEEVEVRLTFTDMLIFLVAKALQDHPLANASWEDGRIRIAKEINTGIATAVEEGLIVPVIKNADQKGLEEIARERFELADKAAKGKLSLEELEGGTFTLTNLGMFGVDEFGAIINPPQSAILAVGRIAQRAVVEGGKVVARPTVRLTLSVDHRVLDGAEGARFLKDLKSVIEEPGEVFMKTSQRP